MALSVVNNGASLNAQQNLGRTSSALNKSLERLSTGLKINRGSDGPAGLVISEQQRAQIAGLKIAIDNTNKAVSLAQTGEGALNELNTLLNKVRALALDSANSGVNEASALAANQAEINNALSTINNIANTTKFGTAKFLLNGEAGVTAAVTANNAGLGAVRADIGATAGTVSVAIGTQGVGGVTNISTAGSGTALSNGGAGGTVTLSGGGLTTGQSLSVVLVDGDTLATSITKIQEALDNAGAIGGGPGKFIVDDGAGNDRLRIRSNVLGSTGISVTTNSVAANSSGDILGLAAATEAGTNGTALAVTVGGVAANVLTGVNSTTGLNNEVQFGGAAGLTFSVTVTNGQTAAAAQTSTVTVTDNALTFQIGANAGETVKVSIDKVTTDRLGSGVSGLTNANTTDLSQINVTTADGAQDAIRIIDQAINDVSNVRAKLGAFQTNSLESNANNLRNTLENTIAAESVIRDTDFASEISNFTRLQTQQQAGATVLGNANQTTALVAQLLRG